MIKLSSLKAGGARERDGEWIDIPDLPGVKLKVRGTGYGPFQAAKGIVEQRWVRRYGKEAVPIEVQLEDNGKLYLDHIVLGWEGFDVPYSAEEARKYLLDPEMRELHDHIRYAMGRVASARIEFAEEAEKNSPAPSAGT